MIHLLDTETINKIAAGEVIERPASVVKELVENAIDAGANRITVEIERGGMSLVRVSDNGLGIHKSDIRNAFVKHATSKISSADDITGVVTLGFRGEALSSIAAVASVSLHTKTGDSLIGYSYQIKAGEEKSFEETGIPEGTTIIVRDLFFNTPVRKKFLKSESAEGAMVGTLMEHIALSNPGVSFTFINNGKEKLSTSGNGDLKELIYSLYGRDITGNLIEIDEGNKEVNVKGFIGKPAISRGNRAFENYAINGRYIKNDSISAAIEEAYKGYIMLHNFPFTALLFEIDHELLDVNVHPAKRELRLTASESVCAFITDVLRRKISDADIVPDVVPGKESERGDDEGEKYEVQKVEKTLLFVKDDRGASTGSVPLQIGSDGASTGSVPPQIGSGGITTGSDTPSTAQFSEETADLFNKASFESESACFESEGKCLRQGESYSKQAPQSRVVEGYASEHSDKKVSCEQLELVGVRETNKFRLIGQLFATYWLIEADDTFYMMDQHAAHEKILYERLMKTVKEKQPQTQYLTMPVVLECSAETADLLDTDSGLFDTFTALGYELEPFGDRSLKITGVPAALPAMDYRQMLTDIIDSITEKKELGINPGDSPQIMIEKTASMSCKAAIKGNDRISGAEAVALLNEMMEAQNPFNCPHGRPTIIAMSKYEIEKKFKRIV